MPVKNSKVPLAWRNLTHDVRRLSVALAGVAFAVLLMCMQVGFQNALFDSTVALIEGLNADIIITSRARYTLSVREPFTRRRLSQAAATPGVQAAYPLYIETRFASWKNPETGVTYPIRVLAFDPDEPVWRMPSAVEQAPLLRQANTVLMDERSKSDYGPHPTGMTAELSGQTVRVVGKFQLGTDFANDGNLLMSTGNYVRYFGGPSGGKILSEVDLGLVLVEPGYDPQQVKESLINDLPDDVAIFTLDEFAQQELDFWAQSTPIGYIFTFGTALGFLVGVIICYQILYADISDHLSEFATLKAMGYRPRYFVLLVLQESLFLSVLGFIPGAIISALLYTVVGQYTGLLMRLTPGRAGFVLLLTVGMCVASGLLAMRNLLRADPAELF
jgi:putative ABC transport system permease protein